MSLFFSPDAKAELCLKIDEMELEKASKRTSIASITVQDDSMLGEMSRLKGCYQLCFTYECSNT